MKSNILLVALLMPMCAVWGQGVYDEVLSVPESTATTKSITRAWKDNVQITCIEDIEYDPYYAGVILSSTAKFVYYDPTENKYRVAEFDNSLWPRVTDMEILEDTLYFCGYANVAASSTSPQYLGYIGYFCIPQLFDGTDFIHVLTFNQQPGTPDAPSYWFVNEPCKIEVFKVSNGIHAICTGGWSTSRGSLFSGGQFVADVVHEFSTGDWWYYIHRGDGTEIFSDVAVTDNYVMTVAPKATLKHLYMRVFTKPQSVSYNPSNANRDPSIFNISTSDQSLLLGSITAAPYGCVSQAESIPTYYHKGSIGDIINCINNNPTFTMKRIPPTAVDNFNAAFNAAIRFVTIKYCTKEIICHP